MLFELWCPSLTYTTSDTMPTKTTSRSKVCPPVKTHSQSTLTIHLHVSLTLNPPSPDVLVSDSGSPCRVAPAHYFTVYLSGCRDIRSAALTGVSHLAPTPRLSVSDRTSDDEPSPGRHQIPAKCWEVFQFSRHQLAQHTDIVTNALGL